MNAKTSLNTWIRFCEPTYIHSRLIAEWWNTWSSFLYCAVGVRFAYRSELYNRAFPEIFCSKSRWINRIFCVCLNVLGLGSASFHAFQTIPTELWDEIAMLITSFMISVCMYDLHPITTGKSAKWFYGFYALFVVAIILIYIHIMNHTFFVLMFLVNVLIPVVIGVTLPQASTNVEENGAVMPVVHCNQVYELVSTLADEHRLVAPLTSSRNLMWAVAVSVIGYAAWQVDQHCVKQGWTPTNRSLYELDWYYWCHPMWHALTAVAAIYGCDALLQVRVERYRRTPKESVSDETKRLF